jgi:AAA family ATP:ADP antiporter
MARTTGRAVALPSREELPFTALMLAYLFLVTATFWILKPLKKALFIQYYHDGVGILGWQLTAPEAELLAKILNMVVAAFAVAVFTQLSRRLRRQALTLAFTAVFVAAFAAYTLVLPHPGDTTVWSFYLFGDLFSTIMVATFFAFLNDSVSPIASKRLYGPIVLGGVAGGAFGALGLSAAIDRLAPEHWLWICCALGLAIATIAWAAGRLLERLPRESRAVDRPPAAAATPERAGSAALEGARLVAGSPYLLSIVAIVGLYEIVSTVMDFQFTSTVASYLEGPAIGAHLSRVFALTNVVALVVQAVVTGLLMTRFGVGTALLVLPATTFLASAAFLLAPTLWIGSLLNTADNGFSYSINQSAKESLYTPTSPEEKYRAKAFIDMFVQRFAKTIGVVASLGMSRWFHGGESARWLSLVSIAVIAVWAIAARYAGRGFDEKTGAGDASEGEHEARATLPGQHVPAHARSRGALEAPLVLGEVVVGLPRV